MRLLLDTHILLWWLAGSAALPKQASKLIADPAGEIFVSVISLWEIAIKSGKGKLEADLDEILTQMEKEGFRVLPVTVRHIQSLAQLDSHHDDPFDRMLVAQANAEPMRLLTHDKTLGNYGESVLLV
ncbi:MAG: type II toxin-antitoxin system VapC family toxin [Sulfuricella sp.]|nr:type II toxin-antitoxin system VapC family toxin [Sulfuricella sp.]